MSGGGVTKERIEHMHERLSADAEKGGYNLNPDEDFAKELVESLLVNQERYGYWSCPCRLAAGDKDEDLDIICPCDYRDADVDEHGACYCALYVSDDIAGGEAETEPIPERRPKRDERAQFKPVPEVSSAEEVHNLTYPVWRCKVCGYLCARDAPPLVCPVCKAKKDRFERFM